MLKKQISVTQVRNAAQQKESADTVSLVRLNLSHIHTQNRHLTFIIRLSTLLTLILVVQLRNEAAELRAKIAEKKAALVSDKELLEASGGASPTKSEAVTIAEEATEPAVSPLEKSLVEPVEEKEEKVDGNTVIESPTATKDVAVNEALEKEEAVEEEESVSTPAASRPVPAVNWSPSPCGPCIKSSEKQKVKQKKGITFGAVQLREFEMTLGGGVPSEGSPIGLGWNYLELGEIEITDYEEGRQGVRKERDVYMSRGYLTAKERYQALRDIGFEDDAIEAEIIETKAMQEERAVSVKELDDAESLQQLGQAFMWWWMCANNMA